MKTAIAQTESVAPGVKGPAGAFGMFFPMVLVFAIFYFLMIRPQQTQQKKHRELLSRIKKGDEVVTASGIHGRVQAIVDDIVTLEVAENVRLRIEKPQVARLK